jgi:hypothetical protein
MEIKELAFRTKLKWFADWGDRYFNMNYIVRRISPPHCHPWQGNKMILELFLW